jgi:hypothetical protein
VPSCARGRGQTPAAFSTSRNRIGSPMLKGRRQKCEINAAAIKRFPEGIYDTFELFRRSPDCWPHFSSDGFYLDLGSSFSEPASIRPHLKAVMRQDFPGGAVGSMSKPAGQR